MRYVTFTLPGDPIERFGALRNGRVVEARPAVHDRWPGTPPATLLGLIEAGADAWRQMASLLEPTLAQTDAGIALESVHLMAPIPHPRKNIFCLGVNYVNHAQESARAREREFKIPEAPVFFTKATTSVNGPFDDIRWDPSVTAQLDYEVELGAVIGRTCKNVARADALSQIFGYTIINDVSARDLQKSHLQWFKGKSLDGSCPMGPVIVTADEFGDPQQKRLSLRLNGDTRQDATTADMIFPIDITIEFLSRGMTLEPGDIIATGTPAGVGLGRTPPEYMKDGDILETEVEGVGTLRNRITQV